MKGGVAEARGERPRWLKKLLWVLLVVVIPLLAAVTMVGIALQVIGVPVVQTAQHYLLHNQASQDVSPFSKLQATMDNTKAQLAAATQQVQSLQKQIGVEKQRETSLSDQVAALQSELQSKTSADAEASQESKVLVGMDPAQAATVLDKMTQDEAAHVVAKMTPADAGQILGEMDPGKAAQILALSAQFQAATGDTGNETSGTQAGTTAPSGTAGSSGNSVSDAGNTG